MGKATTDGQTEYKGYRGPRRVMAASVVATVIGGAAAVASFLIIQIQGVTSSAGGAIVGLFLESGGADADPASTVLVAVFITGFVLAVGGVVSFLFSAAWIAVRFRPGHRAAKGWDRAQPVLSAAGERGQVALESARPKLRSLVPGRGRRAPAPAPVAQLMAPADPAAAVLPASSSPGVPGMTSGDPLATD